MKSIIMKTAAVIAASALFTGSFSVTYPVPEYLTSSAADEAADYILDEATRLHYTVNDGVVKVTGCEDDITDLTIPSELGGMPVRIIGESAFSWKSKLKTVTVEDGVTEIRKSAFSSCRMTAVTLPDSVEFIGAAAFDGCGNLKSFKIPPKVTHINEYCFRQCALTEIEIPDTVVYIGEYAFKDTNISSLYIPASVRTVSHEAFASCDELRVIALENGVMEIGKSAFYGCQQLSAVIFPDTLYYIGESAFEYCRALKKIELPENLISIGSQAFYNTAISELTIPDSVQSIGFHFYPDTLKLEESGGVKYIGKWAVARDQKLTEYVVREGTVGIASNTFGGYTPEGAFSYELPSTLRYISENAFYSGSSSSKPKETFTFSADNTEFCVLDGVIYSKDMSVLVNYPAGRDGESFSVPDGVIYIAPGAFSYCTALKSITFPDTLLEIGDRAFQGCTEMEAAELPEGLMRIGNETGLKCRNTPESLISIGRFGTAVGRDFNQYTMTGDWLLHLDYDMALKQYNTPMSGMADCAMEYKNITDFTCHENMKYIGKRVFYSCNDLTDVKLNEGLLSIDDMAFALCSSLEMPDIPDTVQYIGARAFMGSPKALAEEGGTYYTDNWAVDHAADIKTAELREGTAGIAESAYASCFNLTSVKFPTGLRYINDSAFELCTSLTDVTLSDSVETIGEGAFLYCVSLESVTIPESTYFIDNAAFGGCPELSEITILDPYCYIYPSADTISENAVIYGYSGSTAEEYAELFGRSFVSLGEFKTRIAGDVNADGDFNVADLVAMQRWLLAVPDAKLDDWKAGDLCEDSRIDAFDMILMRRLIIETAGL